MNQPIELQKGTPAHKAYEKGKESAKLGIPPLQANPYVTRPCMHLSNWFMKGYNEQLNQPTTGQNNENNSKS